MRRSKRRRRNFYIHRLLLIINKFYLIIKLNLNMCEKEYSFQNINIEECINKSFTEFVNENQIEFPNLSNKILEKWNFEEYLEKNNILPNDLSANPALIESIPDISTIKPNDNLNEKKLIKFFGTIQNTNENQLYISAKYDSENKTYLINKYFVS